MPGMRRSSSTRSGVVAAHERQDLAAGARLRDDLEVARFLERALDAFCDQAVVVGDQDTDPHAANASEPVGLRVLSVIRIHGQGQEV